MRSLNLKTIIKSGSHSGKILVFLILFASGCATAQTAIDIRAESLGTSSSSLSAYHVVAGYEDKSRSEHKVKLDYEGALIGIEKALRPNICAPKGFDTDRFQYPDSSNKARLSNMKRITDDPKTMFISHIVTYEKGDSSNVLSKIPFLHNAYRPQTAPCKTEKDPSSPYKQGWDALNQLEVELNNKVKNTGDPFTHILIMAMGWNNDQAESVNRYNKIVKHLEIAAEIQDQRFKPLVIGLSWPSVWGTSTIPGWKQLLHLVSYGNKADDADEVGFTYGNYIVNKIARDLKKQTNAKVVLIGHSMGARLLTRSIFSSPLLKNNGITLAQNDHIDYVFGLEGAFSINRFVEGSGLLFPATIFRSGEGYPYSEYEQLKSKLIMTWSENDNANPFSTILNGSAHIGGRVGFERSRLPEKREPFTHLQWSENQEWSLLKHKDKDYQKEKCENFASQRKVFMADLTKFIDNHNDICDFHVGQFMWEAMKCFSSEDSSVSSGEATRTKIADGIKTNETCG